MTKAGVGTNRYAYAGNDPVNLRDPGGNDFYHGVHGIFGPLVANNYSIQNPLANALFNGLVDTLNLPNSAANLVLDPIITITAPLETFAGVLENAAITTPIPHDNVIAALFHSITKASAAANAKSSVNATLPTLSFSSAKMPATAKNISTAISDGAPNVLTRTVAAEIKSNRRAAQRGHMRPRSGHNLDEYPFASTVEGGKNARIAEVPAAEQQSQGGQIGAFFNKFGIKPGDKFKVDVVE